MPLYEYKCPICGELAEQFRSVDKRDSLWGCLWHWQNCNIPMKRVLTPVHLHGSPNMPND